MQDHFHIFEAFLEKRRRGKWKWKVCSADGEVIVRGSDASRGDARYNANRALFQLMLWAPYRSIRPDISESTKIRPLRRTRSTP